MEYQTEIYKGKKGWGIVVKKDGAYYTTLSTKTKKLALRICNEPDTMNYFIEKNIKKGLCI